MKFFDKISKKELSKKTVEGREKAGLKNTVWVFLEYDDWFKKKGV